MRTALTICLILSGALAAAPDAGALATIYKSVMPDGCVIYGEQPQTGARTAEKSVVNVNDTGVQPISREAVEGASRRGSERPQLVDKVSREVQSAEVDLRAAENEREAGRVPLPGEQLGISWGRA